MSEFKYWYYSIPFFTRLWLTGTFLVTLFALFGLLNPNYLIIHSSNLADFYQVWQPLTGLLYYPVGHGSYFFHFAMNCYFIYYYIRLLETETFAGKPGDNFHILLFQWTCCLIAAFFVDWLPFIMDPMVMAGLYLWCRVNKDVQVTFLFVSHMKAKYLPWLMLVTYIIIFGSGPRELLGMMIGHLTYFLKFQLPQEFGGPSLLKPPFFFNWFISNTGGVTFAMHDWGRGAPLSDY